MQLKRNKEMEFETLKKSYKKQIVIGALAVCVIGGALTFSLTRAKYKVDGTIDIAKGTVNYKAYDFKIMAMYKSEDGSNYTEITDRMPASGYIINEEKSYCTIDNKTHDTEAKLYTENGNHIFSNLTKSDKCYLYFDVKKITISDIIAELNEQITTTGDGVYSVSDGMYGGTSYYWRGAVTNNYVRFANFCWRVIRINGDGSIRLIYDGTTCHANGTSTAESIAVTSQVYNSDSNRAEYVGWTYSTGSQRTTSGMSSNIKSQTESWYSSNIIGTNANKVADGNFCNDRDTTSGTTWKSQPGSSRFNYAAQGRLDSARKPTLSCPLGDVYNLKVGAITADEVAYAGGSYGQKNNTYYLYNGQSYWTMTPYCAGPSIVFYVYADGQLGIYSVSSTIPNIRPVINLRSDVTFSSGDGTLNNPYVVQ